MEPGFFDFLATLSPYDESAEAISRLNRRHSMMIQPFAAQIAGKDVLDLAAHDGRWAHAFAGAGAAQVLGIEGRPELVARYDDFPKTDYKSRVTLTTDDIFEGLEKLVASGQTFDVVGVLGIYYHIMDHYRLLRLVRALNPQLVILDSEFALRPGPVIVLSRERTDNPLNSTARVKDQEFAVIGIPSPKAVELMAEDLGFELEWLNWDALPQADRVGLSDYYRTDKKCRSTCVLRLPQ